MRRLKIAMVALACLAVIATVACAPTSSAPIPESQVVAVQRGNLQITITASGNLALSRKEDLTFSMAGTVTEVLVQEGDYVEQGKVLVRLDTTAWEDQIISLERQLTAAERQVTSAERQVTTAERQLATKQRDVLVAKINLKNAQLALENAKDPFRLSTRTVTTLIDPLDIEIKGLQVELARSRVEDAEAAVDDARVAIEDAQKSVEDTQKSVEDARRALAEAKNASPTVTAPFAGFIMKLYATGGGAVKKGSVAVTLTDPNKFEASILVSEMDMVRVQVGATAMVQVDAVSGMSFRAKVTQIYPTGTIQGGVVNYKVKVELESLRPVSVSQTDSGERPGMSRSPARTPSTAAPNIQLREGLTVTVTIPVEERKDVLLVPNRAIIRQGNETYAQVLKDGALEPERRAVKTGASDWRNTEVTSGLSENEKIVLPQATARPQTTPGAPAMRLPGIMR